MKLLALVLFLLVTACAVFSQNRPVGSIKGKVVDAQSKQPLTDATITLLANTDSAAVGYAVADKLGSFEIKNLQPGSFILGISYTGYGEYIKNIDISISKPLIDLDTVELTHDTGMLASVIVSRPPVIINKDTVEFRASAFKTAPNASVEELLKKLPGVEIDKEGNITSQGENITKIYVDGKEFFSNDPKVATKNLTAELVESIQVFDDMSDQAKFTRIDDGSRQRTINIKLKKDRKKGMFGRSNAGIGSSNRYEGNVSFNMFDEDRRLSVVGGANNINRLGFTSSDLISNMGGMAANTNAGRGGRGGGRGGFSRNNAGGNAGNGNTKSWNAGINYHDDWGKRMEFSGNYFVSNTDRLNRSQSFRQNFFPNDSIAFNTEESYNKVTNLNHRFGFRWEFEIDSMNSVLVTPAVSIQHSESMSYDSIVTRATSLKTDYTAITGKSLRSNQRDGWDISNNLLFRHRFRKPGRTFTIGWNASLNESNSEGSNDAPYYFYNPDGSIKRFQNRQQQNDQQTWARNNTISSSLTEMFGKNKVLELNYAYTHNRSSSDRNTYDFSSVSGKYDSVNKPLTNYFENEFIASRIGTNFRVKNQKYDFQVGGAIHVASLHNLSNRAVTGKDSIMEQRYTNFFPNASFNYNLGTRKSLRFNYRGSTRAPGISQLQDVLDVSNPLVYRSGNPNLKQEFNNNVNLSYNTFNVSNFLYFNATLTGGATSNKIVNSIDTIENDIQLIKPENVNGAYNVSFSGTIGIPLKKVTTGRRSPVNLVITTSARHNRDVSKLYQQVNYNYTNTITQRVRFNYNIQDKLDLSTNAALSYHDARYTVQDNLNNHYLSENYSVDVSYTFFKNFMLSSEFDYTANHGRASGFNQSVPLWNAGFSCLMFKKRNAELKLHVIDILNQNRNIDRTIGDNFIEDTYTEVLQRFFMVSFMYNFNKFGGKMGKNQNRPGKFQQGMNGGGRRNRQDF